MPILPLPKMRAAAGGTAWTPKAIADCRHWVAVRRLAPVADSAAVATLPDLSGFGSDLTQATGSKQPGYKYSQTPAGGPSLLFDGSSDSMLSAAFSPVLTTTTLFFVARMVALGANAQLMGGGVSAGARRVLFQLNSGGNKWGAFASATLLGPAADTTNWHVFAYMHNGASSKLWVDNSTSPTIGDAGGFNCDGVVLGADYSGSGSYANMHFAESVLYSRRLADEEVAVVMKRLGGIHGIAVT